MRVGPSSEFSRPVSLEPWPRDGIAFDVAASGAERAAVARRLDVIEVAQLRGEGRIAREAGTGILHLLGRLRAEVVQLCVVTLEPLPVTVDQPLDRRFLTLGGPGPTGKAAEVEVDPLVEEPEPVAGGRLDLGELLVEELALALDPYPRAAQPEIDLPGEVAAFVTVELAASED
jgi:hypothetical protein